MDNDKTLIIALIGVFVIILAGIVAFTAMNPHDNVNQTAYEIPLKSQAFSLFKMNTPENSNFVLKNNFSDVGKGMMYYQNYGKFSNETDGIIINKNMTNSLIKDNMNLVRDNDTVKVYSDAKAKGNYYQVVKSFGDTDIIVSGYNLNLIEDMLDSASVKNDTGSLIKESPVKITNKTDANKTNTTKTVNKTNAAKTANKTTAKTQVETTVEKTPVQKVVETTKSNRISQNNPNPESQITDEPKHTSGPITIGGGSISTGSELEDLTYADIYLGVEHADEEIGIQIFYSRDGNSLNPGNYVTTPVESTGHVNIASANSFDYYPDYATIKVFDSDGNLQDTQSITLEPRSGTQYF